MTLPRQSVRTAWAGAELADLDAWSLDFSDFVGAQECLGDPSTPPTGGAAAELDDVDAAVRRPVVGAAGPGLAKLAEAVGALVGAGPGVARVRGLPVAEVGRRRASELFAWLCRCYGRLQVQDIQGHRVYLVRTIGVGSDRRYGSHGSGDLLFHTDQAAAAPGSLPRVLGMCSIERAESGGETALASGHWVLNQVLDRDPALAAALCTPVWWGRTEGRVTDRPPVRAPMARRRPGGRVDLRLNRYFAEVGASQTGVALPAPVIELLDAVDDVLAQPGAGVSFLLEAGDAVVVDNAVVLHNRSSYVDGPGHERCLARLWVR